MMKTAIRAFLCYIRRNVWKNNNDFLLRSTGDKEIHNNEKTKKRENTLQKLI